MGLIKSKKRVRDYGEVFTPEHIVSDMCDLIPAEIWENIDATFLEPACGNGNFLAEILRRKLERCHTAAEAERACAALFGVDIQEDNVMECRERLYAMCREQYGDSEAVRKILERNIVCGNALTKTTQGGEPIWFLTEGEGADGHEKQRL